MHILRGAVFGLALSLVAAPAFADSFLTIEGIDGESTDDKHKAAIQLESFTTDERPPPPATPAAPAARKGKPTLQDFHFVHKSDKASAVLAKQLAKGGRSPAPSSWSSPIPAPRAAPPRRGGCRSRTW